MPWRVPIGFYFPSRRRGRTREDRMLRWAVRVASLKHRKRRPAQSHPLPNESTSRETSKYRVGCAANAKARLPSRSSGINPSGIHDAVGELLGSSRPPFGDCASSATELSRIRTNRQTRAQPLRSHSTAPSAPQTAALASSDASARRTGLAAQPRAGAIPLTLNPLNVAPGHKAVEA